MSEFFPAKPLRYSPLLLAIAAAVFLSGCFASPHTRPVTPELPGGIAARVHKALADRPEDAASYAGLFEVLALRFDAGKYQTTSEAAAVAKRSAEILSVPGVLKDVVNEELNPLLGTPRPLTREISSQAASRINVIARACREAAQ